MKWIKRSLLALAAVLMAGLCQADGIVGDTYTRAKGNGSWGTLCLPRAITAVEGATLWVPYWCAKSESSWVSPLYIKEIESSEFPIAAGTPVMFNFNYTSNQLTATLSGDDVTEAVKANYMVGNLSETALDVPTGSSDFILAWTWKKASDHSQGGADEIREVTSGTVTIPQYRAYLDLTDIPEKETSQARPNVIGWTLGGGVIDDPTGIVTIDGLETTTAPLMYDLNGRRANNGSHGIVIIEGKKVINK